MALWAQLCGHCPVLRGCPACCVGPSPAVRTVHAGELYWHLDTILPCHQLMPCPLRMDPPHSLGQPRGLPDPRLRGSVSSTELTPALLCILPLPGVTPNTTEGTGSSGAKEVSE